MHHYTLVFGFLTLIFAGCSSVKNTTKTSNESRQTRMIISDTLPSKIDKEQFAHQLIIMYDEKTGSKPLLEAVEKYGAKLIYQYSIIKGIAVAIPSDKTLDEATRYFQKIKGVISVQKDRIMTID